MTYPHDYTPAQRLVMEVNILLGLYDLDLKAGEHYSGMREYQRTRVEELLTEIGTSPEPTLPGAIPEGLWLNRRPA